MLVSFVLIDLLNDCFFCPPSFFLSFLHFIPCLPHPFPFVSLSLSLDYFVTLDCPLIMEVERVDQESNKGGRLGRKISKVDKNSATFTTARYRRKMVAKGGSSAGIARASTDQYFISTSATSGSPSHVPSPPLLPATLCAVLLSCRPTWCSCGSR